MTRTCGFAVHFKAPLETCDPSVPYKSIRTFGEDFPPAVTRDLVLAQPGRKAGLPGTNFAGRSRAGEKLLGGDRLPVEGETALGTPGIRVVQHCGYASCHRWGRSDIAQFRSCVFYHNKKKQHKSSQDLQVLSLLPLCEEWRRFFPSSPAIFGCGWPRPLSLILHIPFFLQPLETPDNLGLRQAPHPRCDGQIDSLRWGRGFDPVFGGTRP